MTRLITTTALLLAATLSGCGLLHHRGDRGAHGGASPTAPRLSVNGKQMKVNEDPLKFSRAEGPVTITWRLPPGQYRFAAEGAITFEEVASFSDTRGKPTTEFECWAGKVPNEHVCLNRNSRPGKYKYTVRALNGNEPLDPYDPFVHNGE